MIGEQFETTTYSNDWQFSPHPTALLLRKNSVSLFVGVLDLQASFGMRLSGHRGVVQKWDVDFGDQPHGLCLNRGERFRSGRFRIFLRENFTVHQMYSEFGRMLIKESRIADPAGKSFSDWWQEPIYCTWGDQSLIANKCVEVNLQEQTAEKTCRIGKVLNEDFVRKALEVIQRERLPVKTILLDEGWQSARGDWRPHPVRFPNFRKLVDELHEAGFKVMVWWTWADIASDAQVPATELVGQGWKNRHGYRWRDYSDPKIQEGYLKPLLRKLFSSDAGSLDLDGIKTDFLADKIHPETPLFDPSWRGEERYFVKITELIYREMRKSKPDALHLGCAGNYWLAEYIDLNRTYDVHSTNWLEHEERAKMLEATAPGAKVSYDMMEATENLGHYLRSARKMNAAIELGNVLTCRKDVFSPVVEPDASYFEIIRQGGDR